MKGIKIINKQLVVELDTYNVQFEGEHIVLSPQKDSDSILNQIRERSLCIEAVEEEEYLTMREFLQQTVDTNTKRC